MNPIILPIYLDQPSSGCVLPLLDFVGANEVHPLGAPPAPEDIQTRREGEENASVDATMAVGLFGMAGIDASSSWMTRSWDWLRFNTSPTTGRGGAGYTVEWGFGYRLHVQSTKAALEGSADAKTIGFHTRLDGLHTSFAAESFGLRDVSIYAALPAPDAFGAELVAALSQAMRAGIARAIKEKKTAPIPLGVAFAGDYAALAVRKAVAVRLAANAILAGKQRAEAVALARERELPEADVARVYDVWPKDAVRAKRLAKGWLGTKETQRKIESLLDPGEVPSAAMDGVLAATSIDRTIVRAQLVDIESAMRLGYGDAGGNTGSSVRRLVYEVFTRSGSVAQVVENGVSRLDMPVSGLVRVNCLQAGVNAEFQGSFSGVAANAVVDSKVGSFSFLGHGYSDALDELQLNGLTKPGDAPDRLAFVAAAFKLLADENNHVPKPLPVGEGLQTGREDDARGFPGARAIICALTSLEDRDRSSEAERTLHGLGFEKANAAAVYRHLWPQGTSNEKPTEGAALAANAWLLKGEGPEK